VEKPTVLAKGVCHPVFFLAKEEKMSSNSLAKWVSIFDKLAKILAARASAPARPARLLILRMTCTCR
jgi:hypothetical protein